MNFEIRFEELNRLILAKSDDYVRMHGLLKDLQANHELVRFMAPAQDNIYASIAHGHRKALACLESGDVHAAKDEMAGTLSWFVRRFQSVDRCALELQAPRVVRELDAVLDLAGKCTALKTALNQSHDLHAD